MAGWRWWPWSARAYECADALQRLDDYLDRQLSPKERRLVESHIATCAECARKFRFERTFVDELRAKLTRIDVPPRLASRVHELLIAAGTEHGPHG